MQETYSYVVFVTVKYEEGGQMYAHPCTGSLISTLHILGTARCTHSGIEKKYINVDGISINVGSNYRKKGLKYYLTALYLHKNYKYSGKFDPNDIAVMEVSTLLKKNLCLHRAKFTHTVNFHLSRPSLI